jgi:hypothetical protein
MTRTTLHLNLVAVFLFTGFFLNRQPAQTIGGSEGTVSEFANFSASVENGEADMLRGVYVPNVLALPVVQQPSDQPYFVSDHDGEVTQFSVASQYGNIGLLAHDTLSGKLFSKLALSQEVRLVYGNGRVERFVISSILRFQALQPTSVTSTFRSLDRNETLSAGDLFNRAYGGKRHLVFQTCIDANGNASWGRLFVLAEPVE